MKEFFKYTLATVTGLVLFLLIIGVLGVMSLVGAIASGEATKNVSDNTVFVINLEGALDERAEEDILGKFTGNVSQAIGLDDMLSAIKKAKENENIKGIYIEAGMFSSDSYASLQTMRNALLDFKKSGKWIVAYGDIYTQSTYYIASVADKVFMNPSGQISWHGMAAQPIFFKDLMAKFGVKMQLAKVGTYKSAPEQFTADKMSDANREQISVYINGIWDNVCKEVSASRKISVDSLNSYADRLIAFDNPVNVVKSKMVDKLIYTIEVKQEIKKLLKLEDEDAISTIGLADIKNLKSQNNQGEEIAIYYAYGNIVDSKQGGDITSQGHVIDAQVVCKDIERLMNDEDVKAVVLRVNSGGGSAYASEQIWNSIRLLKEKKPVVVSMGGMAASGGYYISCNSNWIVAEPTTITGSIGIFGMFPDFSELLTQKLGVKFDEVKTNKNSGIGSLARPINEEEMSYLNAYIDRGYDLFRMRVAEGRKMKIEEVEKVAQGRVWLGQDAFKNKLVDELGGIDKAIKKAASLAKLSEYHTSAYPGKADWTEQLFNEISSGSYIDGELQATLGEYYEPFMMLKNMNRHEAVQARMPYHLIIK
ncbi:MAG: signal peptide peptidase SppA [Prevotella sp.]|nr:signal peptide peptidase SppA [Prevotella sp.]